MSNKLYESAKNLLEIGKRDMSNPKYDEYFTELGEAVNEYPAPTTQSEGEETFGGKEVTVLDFINEKRALQAEIQSLKLSNSKLVEENEELNESLFDKQNEIDNFQTLREEYSSVITSNKLKTTEIIKALEMAYSYFDSCKDEWEEAEEMIFIYIKSALSSLSNNTNGEDK